MKVIAVLGANGFVGSQIAKAVIESNNFLIPIFRDCNAEELIKQAEIVIDSANPAKRYLAENNPENDFKETVEKTAKLYSYSKGKRFILVSSLSCRTQLYTNYGRNRRACELLVDNVIRLGPMFGGNRTQDMLHDILAGYKVYVSEDTDYAYVDVAWVGRKIVDLALSDFTGMQEIGARNVVRLGQLAKDLGSMSIFSGRNETQRPKNFNDGPDANEVYEYVKRISN